MNKDTYLNYIVNATNVTNNDKKHLVTLLDYCDANGLTLATIGKGTAHTRTNLYKAGSLVVVTHGTVALHSKSKVRGLGFTHGVLVQCNYPAHLDAIAKLTHYQLDDSVHHKGTGYRAVYTGKVAQSAARKASRKGRKGSKAVCSSVALRKAIKRISKAA